VFLDLGGSDTYGAPRGADNTRWQAPDDTAVSVGVDVDGADVLGGFLGLP
jgi:hypothetical protein